MGRRRAARGIEIMAAACALMAFTAPIVLWAQAAKDLGNLTASGLILLVYLIAGTYSLRKASRRLLEG